MKKAIVFSMALIITAEAWGATPGSRQRMITDFPPTQAKVHDASNIYFTITNFGILGSQGGNIPDPDWEGMTPGAEFPGGSDIDYLWFGALWIGAEIDTVDDYGNPVLDTLVSIGDDGWWGGMHELFPPYDGESLWEEEIFGDQEYFAVFTDTCTDPSFVTPDPNDGRNHIPLGLKIIRNSLCWSTPGYDEIFFLNYYLENIGGRDLHNAWVGIYYDGDVLHASESPLGYVDDLAGLVQNGDRGIAWLADNDGQPYDGRFDYRSPTNVMAITLVDASVDGLQTNFNWWISNVISDLDWGPQWQSNFDIWGPFPGGGRGTPGGDKAKYQVMSNGEHDYDQIWAALDHTDEGWIPGVANGEDIANGFDTRFLISFGPMEITASATETLTVAYLGGTDLHVDPDNYSQYLQYNTLDSLSIAQYYENLDFSDLLAKADSTISFYENDYTNVPPGPPPGLHIEAWGDDHVTLKWKMAYRPNLLEYRIYRGTEPGVYDPEKITPDNFVDSVFTDTGVEDNTVYYYVIASASMYGLQGAYSPEVLINSGQPQTPAGFMATGGNSEIELGWNDNPDSDLIGYIIYRQFPDGNFIGIDTTQANSYVDTDLTNGLEYNYMIRALDIFENLSFFSDTASAVPMALDSGILLVNSNRDLENPDYDSMAVFYENILQDYQHLMIFSQPEALPQLASFSTVIYAREHVTAFRHFDPEDPTGLLGDYLDAGGNLIVAGTRQITPTPAFEGQTLFSQDDFRSRYLNLNGIEFPDIFNAEFTGGQSVSPLFGDFSVDTARADRIEFPPGENDGRLFGIGTLIPNDSDEVIFGYVAVNPDTSDLHGHPIAAIHSTDMYNTATLEFPLYYVTEPESYSILHTILDEFGEERLGIDTEGSVLPIRTTLFQNYPNPFNSRTVIDYFLSEPCRVEVEIYNILGRKVAALAAGVGRAGYHSVTWDAAGLPSGIYFARLKSSENISTIKLLLLK
jgi:hypothetical protein